MTLSAPSVVHRDARGESARAVVAAASILVVGVGALAALGWRHERVMSALSDAYRADEHGRAEAIRRDVEGTLGSVYQGLRTMARLPTVRHSLAARTALGDADRVTVQELYNNLASGVSMSEVYLVPRGIDPDAIDPEAPHEPMLAFDELIVGRSDGAADEGSEVPEVEVFEYRLMKRQFDWLGQRFAVATGSLDVPVVIGEEVVTCDNSHFDPTHPDDRTRSGIVMTVPVYGPDDRLVGGVSGVIRTDVLREKLAGDQYVLREGDQLTLTEVGRPLVDRPGQRFTEALPVRFAPLGDGEWTLAANRPDAAFFERADVQSETTFFRSAAAAIALASIAAAGFVARTVRQRGSERARVAAVLEITARAADGRLDTEVGAIGDDAVGLLGRAVDDVVRAMRATLRTTGEASRGLDVAASELSAACRGIGSSADQARREIVEVHGTAAEVSQEADQMAAQLGSLSAAIHDVAAAAAHSATLAERGVDKVAAANGCADRLVQASRDVEDSLRLIERITQATRMLAMNATIEAARAGAHGGGFAVVAREVGELARQTADLTRMIHERVDRIGVESDAVRAAVDELAHTTRSIADRQSSITHSVTQQSASATTLADGAHRTATGIARIRDGLSLLGTSADDTVRHARAVTRSADVVVATAAELRTTRERFVLTE